MLIHYNPAVNMVLTLLHVVLVKRIIILYWRSYMMCQLCIEIDFSYTYMKANSWQDNKFKQYKDSVTMKSCQPLCLEYDWEQMQVWIYFSLLLVNERIFVSRKINCWDITALYSDNANKSHTWYTILSCKHYPCICEQLNI